MAIGKGGQNARLAARLTDWKIDIKSESQFREMLAKLNEEENSEADSIEEDNNQENSTEVDSNETDNNKE